MIFYGDYADVPDDVVDAFVQSAHMGRLVSVGADGSPHIGLYPFVYLGHAVEMHLNRKDEQYADLKERARCLFEIDEVLATIPSYWIHPEDAVMATAYHRTVIFECDAVLSEDATVLAAQQARIMKRYQPEGGYKAIAPDDPLYRAAIAHIVALRLDVRARRVKFKLGQNRAPEVRANVARELRKRGRHDDASAADALEWTLRRKG
jgi:uncharacterized protein